MRATRSEHAKGGPWRLQDAKARFSEVVRLARQAGPQRVTVRGRDAVVVVSSEEYDSLRHPETGAALLRAMADPRARDLAIEPERITPSVRDVNL
jgi:prevent-host-death family protein